MSLPTFFSIVLSDALHNIPRFADVKDNVVRVGVHGHVDARLVTQVDVPGERPSNSISAIQTLI